MDDLSWDLLITLLLHFYYFVTPNGDCEKIQ